MNTEKKRGFSFRGFAPYPGTFLFAQKGCIKRAPSKISGTLRSGRPTVNRFKLGPFRASDTNRFLTLRPPSATLRFSHGERRKSGDSI